MITALKVYNKVVEDPRDMAGQVIIPGDYVETKVEYMGEVLWGTLGWVSRLVPGYAYIMEDGSGIEAKWPLDKIRVED